MLFSEIFAGFAIMRTPPQSRFFIIYSGNVEYGMNTENLNPAPPPPAPPPLR